MKCSLITPKECARAPLSSGSECQLFFIVQLRFFHTWELLCSSVLSYISYSWLIVWVSVFSVHVACHTRASQMQRSLFPLFRGKLTKATWDALLIPGGFMATSLCSSYYAENIASRIMAPIVDEKMCKSHLVCWWACYYFVKWDSWPDFC